MRCQKCLLLNDLRRILEAPQWPITRLELIMRDSCCPRRVSPCETRPPLQHILGAGNKHRTRHVDQSLRINLGTGIVLGSPQFPLKRKVSIFKGGHFTGPFNMHPFARFFLALSSMGPGIVQNLDLGAPFATNTSQP
jgi:hypothetical protein